VVDAAPAELASETLSEAAAVEAVAASGNVMSPETAVGSGSAETGADAAPSNEETAAASATLLPGVSFLPDQAAAEPVEAKPEAASSAEQPLPAPQQDSVAAAVAPDAVTADPVVAASADIAAATEAAPEATAPETVEVWRPAGRSEERRPRPDRNRRRHHDGPQEGVTPAAAAEAGDAAKPERHGRPRRNRHNEFRKPRPDAPTEGVTAAAPGAAQPSEPREDKANPPRERFHRDKDKAKFGGRDKGGRDKGGRDKGGRDKGGRDKRSDSGPSHRQYATSAAPRERDRPIDPNSPFAKLAALKEQLAANRKD
jgi:ATP-dependent RNA helicase SUPV3L1/SUV3